MTLRRDEPLDGVVGAIDFLAVTEWTEVDDSAVDTAQTVTHAAEADRRHYVTCFEVVVSGADVGAADINIEILEGATVRWRTKIGANSVRGERSGVVFQKVPVQIAIGSAVSLTASAGGAGVVTTLNLGGQTR